MSYPSGSTADPADEPLMQVQAILHQIEREVAFAHRNYLTMPRAFAWYWLWKERRRQIRAGVAFSEFRPWLRVRKERVEA